jgi:glycosyltransferase involved in cell wall biosynthesis
MRNNTLKILWIAPNLNHYKARFLNRLVEGEHLELAVLAGHTMEEMGHRQDQETSKFKIVHVKATKRTFHKDPSVYIALLKLLASREYHSVLMPAEKKHLPCILFLFTLQFIYKYRLISYNHPVTRSRFWNPAFDRLITQFLFSLYDRIIFYTKEGRDLAVKLKLLPAPKAFFANNTLDTREIWRHYDFEVNKSAPKVILFIGRLIRSKRVDLLLEYFEELKAQLPGARLIVVGNGPEAHIIKCAAEKDKAVTWLGAVMDEACISPVMRQAHAVFVPGWSGLSIVHAFCYGKPYVTIRGPHPPEIDYLIDHDNGLILSGNIADDCQELVSFLSNQDVYENACRNAFRKAQTLSVENWCEQIYKALV